MFEGAASRKMTEADSLEIAAEFGHRAELKCGNAKRTRRSYVLRAVVDENRRAWLDFEQFEAMVIDSGVRLDGAHFGQKI